jgi:hypothetical protein
VMWSGPSRCGMIEQSMHPTGSTRSSMAVGSPVCQQ